MANRESVIEKVKKLLNLASNNANVNESATAAGLAQQLMLEHKLAVAEIETNDQDADDIVVAKTDVNFGATNLPKWKSILLASLTKASCCVAVRITGANVSIVGTQNDTNYVLYVFALLTKEIDRLAAKEAKGQGRSYSASFRFGAVMSITERLQEAKKAAGATSSTALSVLDKSLAVSVAAKNSFFPKTTVRTARCPADEAYAAGRVCGESIHLPGTGANRALGAAPARLRA